MPGPSRPAAPQGHLHRGEPLLRPDLIELLEGLRVADPDHRVLRCLNTNGHLVTPELAHHLVGLADEVRVSLDALPERNDRLHGAGNFAAAIRTLETYYQVGFEPKVLVTITPTSLPDLEELLCFLLQRKITRVNLNGFRPIGRGGGHAEWQASPTAARAALRRAWERSFPGQPLPAEQPEPESCSNCGVGSFLNILLNGDVFRRHVLTQREFRCGNIREERLTDICRRTGLLGHLQALDFHDLAREGEQVAGLTQPRACMGNVYATTRSLPI